VEDRGSSFTFSMFSLPQLLPWAGCTASSQSREQRSMSMWRTGEAPLLSRCSLCPGCFPGRDVQRLRKAGNKGRCLCGGPEKLLYFLDVLFAPVASLGGMYSVFANPGTKVDVYVEDRRSSFTFSMFSLPRLALPWARCTASSQSWEHRVVDVDGPEKLLDFLDILLATVGAALGGMYGVFAKPGTKVDVDVEDRRSSFTFSMFSLPRLALPWAGCTASSQSREQRSMSMWRTGEAPLLSRCSLCPGCFPGRDVQRLHKAGNKGRCRCGGPEKLLDFLYVLRATVGAALGGMYRVCTKPGTEGGRCRLSGEAIEEHSDLTP
jgi:hypothetical protein